MEDIKAVTHSRTGQGRRFRGRELLLSNDQVASSLSVEKREQMEGEKERETKGIL